MRDFALDDGILTGMLYETNRATFLEDVYVIEAQQRNLALSPGWVHIGVPADRGTLLAARLSERLIAAEAGAVDEAGAPSAIAA